VNCAAVDDLREAAGETVRAPDAGDAIGCDDYSTLQSMYIDAMPQR
jgi:hypothetical protein